MAAHEFGGIPFQIFNTEYFIGGARVDVRVTPRLKFKNELVSYTDLDLQECTVCKKKERNRKLQ